MASGTVDKKVDVENRNVLSAPDRDVLSNALLVDVTLYKDGWNRPYRVTASGSANMPSNCSWGVREVLSSTENHLQVRITGQDKNGQSAMWTNCLANNTWAGWRQMDSSIHSEKATFNSLASLSTILNTELETMVNNEIRHIRLNCNGSFGAIFYSGVAYFIDLKRSSMNYSSCMMQGVGYPSQVFGVLTGGVWTFRSLYSNMPYKTSAWPGTTVSYDIPKDGHLYRFTAMNQAGALCNAIILMRSDSIQLANITSNTVSQSYSAGTLTLTLPSNSYWECCMEQLHSTHDVSNF